MATEQHAWRPDWTVAPGEILLEALEERGMSQSELARRMGRPTKTINEIVNAKAALTPETAIQLERTLGIEASFWNQLEILYREHLAHERARQELERYTDWLDRFPVADLERRRLIAPKSRSKVDRLTALFEFFQVASVEAWRNQWLSPAASFRQSSAFDASPEAMAAWLRWGEVEAAKIETKDFDVKRLRDVVREIRDLTRRGNIGPVISQIQTLLASAGVVLVITPEFRGTHVSGAARWLAYNRALIQLSLRYKTNDHFWFSLFHEIGHVIERKGVDYVDVEIGSASSSADEQVADQFARDTLIDPESYARFVAVSTFSEQYIREFAGQEHIAPGIVVGRLQRDGLLDRSHCNSLKKKVDLAGL